MKEKERKKKKEERERERKKERKKTKRERNHTKYAHVWMYCKPIIFTYLLIHMGSYLTAYFSNLPHRGAHHGSFASQARGPSMRSRGHAKTDSRGR